MRIEAKLSCIRLLVALLLLMGVQMFAQAGADSSTIVAGPASHNVTKAEAGVVVISDRAFLMKSIAGSAGCSSSILSVGGATSRVVSGCPRVDCAAPPPGCFYQGPPATGSNGCPINCGTLVCGPETP